MTDKSCVSGFLSCLFLNDSYFEIYTEHYVWENENEAARGRIGMSEKKYEIPMFSARITRRTGTGVFIFVVIFIFFDLLGLGIGKGLAVAGIVIFVVVYLLLSRRMKRCVWRFQEDCIKEIGLAGIRDISYGEIAEALQSRKIRIQTTRYQVPKRRGYISFHYEVGNSKLQKEIKESYRFLEEKVSMKLPRLTRTVIQQMDRRFCYKKDRISCSIVMLLVSFTMFFYRYEPMLRSVAIVGTFQAIQYLMLGSVFKGIYFGKKTEEKIQETAAKYPNAELKKVRVTYVPMAIVAVLTALLNLFWIII